MIPSLQKLQKFIKLEIERGFDNRAVVGGLDRILDWWELEARNEGLAEVLVQFINARLRDYSRLSADSRLELLRGLWTRLQREAGAAPLPELFRQPTAVPGKPPLPGLAAPARPSEEPSDSEELDFSASSRRGKPVAALIEAPTALDAPVSVLSGVGPRYAQTLGKMGMHTLRDMLYYFPRRYDDYSQLKPINRLTFGDVVTVIGTVQNYSARKIRSGKQIVEAIIHDGTAAMRLVWFNPYVARRLHGGLQISVSGKVEQYLGRPVMSNPEWEPIDQQMLSTNRIAPVYPLSGQITQQWLRKIMNNVVSHWAPRVTDHLPPETCQQAGLLELQKALMQIHFPDSHNLLQSARYRLAFDEIFLLQLGLLQQKSAWQERSARVIEAPEEWFQQQIERLPFALTGAQQRALESLRQDLRSGRPMNRLLQGDVGSGKTIVAALAIAIVGQAGSQSALMAPTGILAEQHYRSLQRILCSPGGPFKPEQVRLLTGATPEAEKNEIRQQLEQGDVRLLIGTHALIEDPVTFSDLQLVIIDEQHRFGVEQRAALRSKGNNPHLLVMTATPIPRSLALTIYGDLDLSIIDEMPPGRQEVATYVLTPRERERAYRLIRSQVEAGRQAFVIYPLVEEGENGESQAAVEGQAYLQSEVFPNFKVGLLHGRLSPAEKEDAMQRFLANETHILVSTSVVEVGVDVPNATVMLIEGANRFGLAQLHQFRGRVGRGHEKSYCLLVAEKPEDIENQRLQAMATTNDGFKLAEMDLEQRGAGDFLGTRQSGFGELQLASLTNLKLIENAQKLALTIFEEDPGLQHPKHAALAGVLQRFWTANRRGDIS